MLKIDVKKKYGEAKWFTKHGETPANDDPKFLIRTMPQSMEKFIGKDGGEVVIPGETLLKKFIYCLVGWENVLDSDGNQLELTEQIKQLVFDESLGSIPKFVNECLAEMAEERRTDSKN